MTFGKYKAKIVEEVYEINPSYFHWMKKNGLDKKVEYQYFIEVMPQYDPEMFQWEVDFSSGYECWSCHHTMDIFLMFNPERVNELRDG